MRVIGTVAGSQTYVMGFPSRARKGEVRRIGRAVSGMWDGIVNGFKGAINTVIRWWNSLGFNVPVIDLGPVGKFGGFHIGTLDIPTFHQGGIVPGLPGSDVPAILQAGERVVPLAEASSPRKVEVTVNLNVRSDGSMDERRLTEALSSSIFLDRLEHLVTHP